MKYMGSKSRISKEILQIILKNRREGQWYVEPFCGGCNMIDKVGGNRIANDNNFYLIEMWKDLTLNGYLPQKIGKEEYKEIRENKEKFKPGVVGWVGFNCSYSGKFFGGFAGEVMTKAGVRDYQAEAQKNVLKQIQNLRGIVFENKEFFNLDIPSNSIIYCDPPYEKTTGYSSNFDHIRFWDWCRRMVKIGHEVYISEYQAPDDFICIWSKTVKSSLSANGKSGTSKDSIEKLFKHSELL